MVLASPESSSSFSSSKKPLRVNKKGLATNNKKGGQAKNKVGAAAATSKEDAIHNKWLKAETIEQKVNLALQALQEAMALQQQQGTANGKTSLVSDVLFPSVRECNSALAAFGDGGDLKRALRLFMKMRKAALLKQHLDETLGWSCWPVPTPTLVTYSTIMSRANRMGKPRVALRMWKLMQKSPDFFIASSTLLDSKDHHHKNHNPPKSIPLRLGPDSIIPDIKAANILMNTYAKLADVESARDLLNQMRFGNGTDVPRMAPNLITYNTFLDSCHKASDLDAALQAMEQLQAAGQIPDAWSYTSLIATVARKPSTASGANDPSLAFTFLEEMKARNIQPNGMTYSALIDVCGRCKRCDLALQGLRMMLRQKMAEQEALANTPSSSNKYKGKPEKYSLSNEVGAWTAAINALGKEGRIQAAVKLFFSMPNFGVKPNAVTCGCLTDSLLKHGRTADTLQVLRYMEENDIAPSEVMYTSLMSSAENLAQLENKNEWLTKSINDEINGVGSGISQHATSCSAIEVYTVLMKSLTEDAKRGVKREMSRTEVQEANAHSLMKVFLVFQEMKEAGAQPDLACYNALLRACARVGDISRAQSVLRQLQEVHLEPNDTTWRQLIRAAGNARRADIVLSTWKMAMDYSYDIELGTFSYQIRSSQWTPSINSFSSMISALMKIASSDPTLSNLDKQHLYKKVVLMYVKIVSGNKDDELGMHRVDAGELVEDWRAMMLVLQAAVSLDHLTTTDASRDTEVGEQSKLRYLAIRILGLDVMDGISQKQRLSRSAHRSLSIAQSWRDGEYAAGNLRP